MNYLSLMTPLAQRPELALRSELQVSCLSCAVSGLHERLQRRPIRKRSILRILGLLRSPSTRCGAHGMF